MDFHRDNINLPGAAVSEKIYFLPWQLSVVNSSSDTVGFDVQISMSIMGFGLILADTGLMNVIVTICEFCVLWPCSVLETVFTWSSNSVGSYILSTTILKKTSRYIYICYL